ncbi:MAG TPA: alpha/beta family hydrolase [Chloroflexota bacterium]
MGGHSGRQTRPGGVTELSLAAVLAPGYGGSAEQPILRAMAAELTRVGIAPHAMSFSRKRPVGDFTPELDDLRRVRDAFIHAGATRVALVGRSFGGRMCARLAAIEPPPALVLLGHPISPPNHPRPDDEAALAAVSCPTLIVQGDRDHLGPLDILERIAAQNSQIEIVVLTGAGHQFGARQAEGLRRAADWLVSTLEPR